MSDESGCTLEKRTWDASDFETLGFHDATLWSTLANPDDFEYLLDLDYLFKWVHPGEGESYFKFWVSPVTLIFENVADVRIEINSSQGTIEVADLHREDPERTPNDAMTSHRYRFECREGELSLRATGFRMVVRQAPILLRVQNLSLAQRRGVGFGRDAY